MTTCCTLIHVQVILVLLLTSSCADGYRSYEIVQSYQFRSYKARAFLYALRLEEGVSSISSYLSLSPPISHPVLGKLWYLQGKIYEEKYDQLANRRRESKQRRPRKATEDSLEGQTGTPDLQQLMTQKEVACQALECYKKAVSYFSAVEDVQNQAKSSARLSSFMLKRIFESGRERGDSTELLKVHLLASFRAPPAVAETVPSTAMPLHRPPFPTVAFSTYVSLHLSLSHSLRTYRSGPSRLPILPHSLFCRIVRHIH